MHSSGGHGQDPRAEVPRTGDVVGRVANHDELLGLKVRSQVLVDSLRCDGRQVAAIERLVSKGTRQLKELREAGQFQLQISSGLYVAGEQSRTIARMVGHSLQDLAPARHSMDSVRSIAGGAFHFFNITTKQFIPARDYVLAGDAFTTQRLFDNLEIRHA